MNAPNGNNSALRKLAAKIVQHEIEKRTPLDADVLTRAVMGEVSVSDDGDILFRDPIGGIIMNGTRPLTLSQRLDALVAEKPSLFAKAEKAGAQTEDNPFKKGENFSVSRQMLLMKTDPELADHLAAEAGAYVPKQF